MNYASKAGYRETSFTVTTPTMRPACPSFTAKLYPKGSVKVGVLSLTSVICTRRLPVVACKNKRYDLNNFSITTSYFYILAFLLMSKSRPERVRLYSWEMALLLSFFMPMSEKKSNQIAEWRWETIMLPGDRKENTPEEPRLSGNIVSVSS